MAGRIGTVAFAVLVLSVSVAASRRAILSEAGGAQFELGDVQGMHRHLMGSLKSAQEKAGIFVDDVHLFEQPLSAQGRKLQQSDAAATALTNPNVLATLLTMVSQGLNVGSFPGAALSLPGGSAFGYSPTDESYCLFATQPYSGPPATPVTPGPLPSGGVPDAFGCVAASSDIPAGPGSFTIDVNGEAFVCQGVAPPPSGRKLLQAPSPTEAAIGNALSAIGLPIWNCVVATTPAGNTTLGDATLAVLNDLGVVAEHLLVYLNADGALTYEQNIANDFVSLTNPLYPTGPRLNFSIDFSSFDKDKALFEEIFGKPAPPAPPPAVPVPVTPVTPDTPPTTPSDSGSTGAPSSGDTGSSDTGATTTPTDTSTPTTPSGAPPPPADTTTLTAFDGYVDNCQVVIGSIPHADGNFDRNNNFSTVIVNGSVDMPLDTTNSYAGQVAYIIPASKATEYPALTADTRSTAQFCNDIASLEPVYNPLASVISANATSISANPLTTVASFGQSYGLTADALLVALGLAVPDGETLWSYDALADAAGSSATGLTVLKANTQVANLVTSGANMLTNDSTLYASFAIIMNQAIAKKVLYSPPGVGRRLLQAPAVDLTNATTLASIMTIAAQLVPTQSDASTVAALTQGLTADQMAAVAQAVANLNAAVAASTDADSIEKGQYYAQTELAPQVAELAAGTTSTDDFNALTSTSAISDALSKTTLPGTVTPAAATPPAPAVVPQTQSSTASTQSAPAAKNDNKSGLSHGGKVALATILPIFGVIAIVAVAAFLITRRNRGTYEETNNSTVWWRRPFARSGSAPGPSTV